MRPSGSEALIYAALNVAVVCTGLLFWVAEATSRPVTLLAMPFAPIAANLTAWVGFRYRKRLAAADGMASAQRKGFC